MTVLASWYHAHLDPVSRGEGKSAVGLAAYMTGETLKDERTGLWCKRNHPGEVLDWGTTAPKDAPSYLTDDEQLSKAWNDVESSEKRKDSHVANHWNVGSAGEFSEADHIEVAQRMAQKLTDRYGVMVTWAVHKPTEHGDERNWHIHLGYNMRRIDEDGFGDKVRVLSDRKTCRGELDWQRKMVADALNDRLELVGSNERVSHETYERQGVDREPTKHLGNKQNQMELQGVRTPTGDENREIEARNRQRLEERTAAVAAIHSEVQEMAEPDRYNGVKREGEEAGKIKAQADDLVAKAKEMAQVKERLTAFEEDTKKQADRAKQQQDELRKADEKRIANGDVRSAQNRYAEALAGTYDVRRPYASLANAAMAEYGILSREDQAMRRQAAREPDPAKRSAIEQRREIMILDYMAFTSERLANQSEVTTGRADSPEAIRQRERAAEARHQAAEKRGQMTAERDAQRKLERQQVAEKLAHLANNVAQGSVIEGSGLRYTGAEPRGMTAAQRKEREKRLDQASQVASGETSDHAPAKVVARSAEETKQREGLRTGETAEGKPATREGREADRSEKSEIAKAWAAAKETGWRDDTKGAEAGKPTNRGRGGR